MFDVREYSPSEVVMTFGGYRVEGWERIVIKRIHPSFRFVAGIRGQNTRVSLGNSAAEVEVILTQTSPTNSVFAQIVALDEQYGTGRIELTIKDVLSGEKFQSTQAYLESPAEQSFSSDISERSWKLVCLSSNSDMGTGGALGSLVDRVTSFF